MIKNSELFDLEHTIAKNIFTGKTYPWEVLADINSFILELGKTLPQDEFDHPSEGVWIAKDAEVAPTAFVGTPVIIDHNAKIKHCAFIRENAIVGKGATVGNSTELKNVILFDEVEVPHYNYVGDAILGYNAHMGAGAVTSNVKGDKKNVVIHDHGTDYETNRKKVGAMLGDYAEIGCNSVLNPGTVIGKHTQVYPLSSVRGVVDEYSIYKSKDSVVKKK